jgi:hypothetical protein
LGLEVSIGNGNTGEMWSQVTMKTATSSDYSILKAGMSFQRGKKGSAWLNYSEQ